MPARAIRQRAWTAEREFFRAYGRDGACHGERLVVPRDYFSRADVARCVHDWLAGRRALDVDALERAWFASRGPPARGDLAAFHRNLAHYRSLV